MLSTLFTIAQRASQCRSIASLFAFSTIPIGFPLSKCKKFKLHVQLRDQCLHCHVVVRASGLIPLLIFVVPLTVPSEGPVCVGNLLIAYNTRFFPILFTLKRPTDLNHFTILMSQHEGKLQLLDHTSTRIWFWNVKLTWRDYSLQYWAKVMQAKCMNFVLCSSHFSKKARWKVHMKFHGISSINSLEQRAIFLQSFVQLKKIHEHKTINR